MVSPGLAHPKQIWVYDFIATPAKIPADSSISADLSAPSTPPTADELEIGHELGALIAKDLVADIQDMGFSAAQAGLGSAPQVGDGIIRGYLVSVQEDKNFKRHFRLAAPAGGHRSRRWRLPQHDAADVVSAASMCRRDAYRQQP